MNMAKFFKDAISDMPDDLLFALAKEIAEREAAESSYHASMGEEIIDNPDEDDPCIDCEGADRGDLCMYCDGERLRPIRM